MWLVGTDVIILFLNISNKDTPWMPLTLTPVIPPFFPAFIDNFSDKLNFTALPIDYIFVINTICKAKKTQWAAQASCPPSKAISKKPCTLFTTQGGPLHPAEDLLKNRKVHGSRDHQEKISKTEGRTGKTEKERTDGKILGGAKGSWGSPSWRNERVPQVLGR